MLHDGAHEGAHVEVVDGPELGELDLEQLPPLEHVELQQRVVEGQELFEVQLSQLRAVYNFNVRTFVRAIVQYQDLKQDPSLYTFPTVESSEDLFTQLLFSYKLNPQTVLFVGYSDASVGFDQVELTRTDRTFFVKVGYAWLL